MKTTKVMIWILVIGVWTAAMFYVGWQSPTLFGKNFKLQEVDIPTAKYFPLKRVVVTVPGKDYSHYLLLEMALKTEGKDVKSILEQSDSLIRNTLMKMFTQKSYEELNNPKNMVPLQLEVQSALNQVLIENNFKLDVEQVLFTRMVIQ